DLSGLRLSRWQLPATAFALCVTALALLGLGIAAAHAAGTTIYRCESDAGVSLQSSPCAKGAKQTKRSYERLPDAPPKVASAPVAGNTQASAMAQAIKPTIPLTAAADMRGPNQPYPLWECMRPDGSTFESRDGVAGRQWVPTPGADAADSGPAQITTAPKANAFGVVSSRPIESAEVAEPASLDPKDAPPADAPPGQWVVDQCTRLEAALACERHGKRRDALRKQIYDSMPSDRYKYAPEEQDLTRMLYAACGR
ncbi:MAG: hypothetical protein ABIQ97_02195, partial [Lysobacteraceae bacterium]